jgi:hypothetical protein
MIQRLKSLALQYEADGRLYRPHTPIALKPHKQSPTVTTILHAIPADLAAETLALGIVCCEQWNELFVTRTSIQVLSTCAVCSACLGEYQHEHECQDSNFSVWIKIVGPIKPPSANNFLQNGLFKRRSYAVHLKQSLPLNLKLKIELDEALCL